MRRWLCPDCGGGVFAPDRPRTDDVRRFCLDCSKRTGRMVNRTCPALDRQREKSTERSKAKATVKRRKVSATRAAERQRVEERRERGAVLREATAAARVQVRTVAGVDLLDLARRCWETPTFRELRSERPRVEFPAIEFRRHRAGLKAFTSGHCETYSIRSRIVVTVGTDEYGAWNTVVHELTHAVLPVGEKHSTRFWTMMQSATSDLWPDVAFRFKDAPSTRGYKIGRWIADRLRDHYRPIAGHVLRPVAAAPSPGVDDA